MKVLLLTLVLAVVIFTNCVSNSNQADLPSEFLDEINSQGFDTFQEYLKWKDAQPLGSDTRFQTFFNRLKAQREIVDSNGAEDIEYYGDEYEVSASEMGGNSIGLHSKICCKRCRKCREC